MQKRSINKGATFRIMPFGGSITVGKGSTQLNGYRRDLRNRLVNGGNKVEFVGTKSGGTMGGKFEAVSGYTIAHMDSTALNDGAYKSLPNVIVSRLYPLIHAAVQYTDNASSFTLEQTTATLRAKTPPAPLHDTLPSSTTSRSMSPTHSSSPQASSITVKLASMPVSSP